MVDQNEQQDAETAVAAAPFLEAQQMSCGYDQPVLDRVSVRVQRAELLAILGANGSGKTTLLHALARTLRPQHGAVMFGGRSVWRVSSQQFSRRVALSPQAEQCEWPLTVEQAVSLGRLPHRGWLRAFAAEDRAAVHNSLERCCLLELQDRPVDQLSGGEWRRVIVARALAQQAELMLFDEPLAALDLRFQLEVLSLFKHLVQTQRLGIAVTMHDLNAAAIHADRLVLLRQGQVLAEGDAWSVLTEPNLRAAFGIHAEVIQHPQFDRPLVLPGRIPG